MSLRESDILALVQARLGSSGVAGPGDDLAVVPAQPAGSVLLAGADAMIEGRHFIRGTDWRLVGRKAINRNLSDVAAMGAEPVACTACAQFRPDQPLRDVERLLDGLTAACAAHGCPLIGGDTTIHDSPEHPFTISVGVIASLPRGASPFTRSGARAGQGIYVTGSLGGSFGGGHGRHLTFEPRLAVARELRRLHESGEIRIGAMIDLSDGLGRDASRVAVASGMHLAIEARLVPVSPGCTLEGALGDGEDYELLFIATSAPAVVAGIACTRIGAVLEPVDGLLVGAWLIGDGHGAGGAPDTPRNLADAGWDHGQE